MKPWGTGHVPRLSFYCRLSESLRLEFRSLIFHARTLPYILDGFLLHLPLNIEIKMGNLKIYYCFSAEWQALWELSNGFGAWLSNYNHTLKFSLAHLYPWWFLLTLRICWWFLNPFWRRKVFLFSVCFPSSFQIYYSLDFSPLLP